MPQLGIGSMDDVKTGFEIMEAQKKVRVKVLAPKEVGKEVWENEDKTLKCLKFNFEILEGAVKGRWISMGFTPVAVAKEVYLTWKLQSDGQVMTEQEKSEAWDRRDYLKDLKRFGDAIGVNFANQDSADAIGKELLIDIVQKIDKESGEPRNEAKNYKKVS